MIALGLARPPVEAPLELPYRLKTELLSAAELDFYRVLCPAVSRWAVICPKVRLGDLFYAQTGDWKANRSHTSRINQKHVDFVLCDPQTMRPLVGIELDDASHRRESRQRRDKLVDGAFGAAGLPLHRFRAAASYDGVELAAVLRGRVAVAEPEGGGPAAATVDAAAEGPALEAPLCPKCGKVMVVRIGRRKGPHFEKRFWGCPGFPRCRGVREAIGG
jgi:hypothetical protein